MLSFLAGLAGIHILKDEVGVVLLNKSTKCYLLNIFSLVISSDPVLSCFVD